MDWAHQRVSYSLRLNIDECLTTFNPDFSPEKVNESDEEINNDICGQELLQTRQTQNLNSVDQIILQKLTDINDDSDS